MGVAGGGELNTAPSTAWSLLVHKQAVRRHTLAQRVLCRVHQQLYAAPLSLRLQLVLREATPAVSCMDNDLSCRPADDNSNHAATPECAQGRGMFVQLACHECCSVAQQASRRASGGCRC
jgi:hypothetical protein